MAHIADTICSKLPTIQRCARPGLSIYSMYRPRPRTALLVPQKSLGIPAPATSSSSKEIAQRRFEKTKRSPVQRQYRRKAVGFGNPPIFNCNSPNEHRRSSLGSGTFMTAGKIVARTNSSTGLDMRTCRGTAALRRGSPIARARCRFGRQYAGSSNSFSSEGGL